MIRPTLFAALAGLSLAAAANVPDAAALRPVYADAGQYTATLHSLSQTWELTPIAGDPVQIHGDALCPRSDQPLPGLWVLTRGADGQPELVAPSATLLPEGHSGRVALRACSDPALRSAEVKAYGVPQQVLDLLVANSGAVLVDD